MSAHQTSRQGCSDRWYDLAYACETSIEDEKHGNRLCAALELTGGARGVGRESGQGGAGMGDGEGRTKFCSLRLDGCYVTQRVSKLLAAGTERRRLANVRDPPTLLFSEVIDSCLVLQRRGWHVQWAGSCQTFLELRSAMQQRRMGATLDC